MSEWKHGEIQLLKNDKTFRLVQNEFYVPLFNIEEIPQLISLLQAKLDEKMSVVEVYNDRKLNKESHGIHNLKWLQEFTKEAGVNPEPWAAFEFKEDGYGWHDLDQDHCLQIFAKSWVQVRRKPQKQKVWQWKYRFDKGTWNVTPQFKTADDAIRFIEESYLCSVNPYEIKLLEESEEEIEE